MDKKQSSSSKEYFKKYFLRVTIDIITAAILIAVFYIFFLLLTVIFDLQNHIFFTTFKYTSLVYFFAIFIVTAVRHFILIIKSEEKNV